MPTVLLLVALAQAPVTVNGRPVTAQQVKLPAGAYWYDNATGALGAWGGPTLTFLQPGLRLGGALPANASGGGNGQLTGVFINGRELHPVDVQGLAALLNAPPLPGRWWVDAWGNCGVEGGPPMFNLFALAKQNAAGGSTYFKNHGDGKSTTVTKGCAAVHGSLGSGESKSDYSYYVGCE